LTALSGVLYKRAGDDRWPGHDAPAGPVPRETRSRLAEVTARSKAVLGTAVGFAVVAGLVSLYVLYWIAKPPAVQVAPARVTLQTVAALGPRYEHPDWVSYLTQDARGKWVHSTEIRVPANSRVRVTILQYDSATGLRNPFFARVQGTSGGVAEIDGKRTEVVDPSQPGHTFAIPQLGVYVPLPGVPGKAPNQCSAAPCTRAQAHRTITFTFRTGAKGRYRWQCFVPCGAGYYAGLGGPMQAFGYMAGYLDVV
jgi:hypothetical protein